MARSNDDVGALRVAEDQLKLLAQLEVGVLLARTNINDVEKRLGDGDGSGEVGIFPITRRDPTSLKLSAEPFHVEIQLNDDVP